MAKIVAWESFFLQKPFFTFFCHSTGPGADEWNPMAIHDPSMDQTTSFLFPGFQVTWAPTRKPGNAWAPTLEPRIAIVGGPTLTPAELGNAKNDKGTVPKTGQWHWRGQH